MQKFLWRCARMFIIVLVWIFLHITSVQVSTCIYYVLHTYQWQHLTYKLTFAWEIKKLGTTGGAQIVLFSCPQGTVLLRKLYYLGTDLVLQSRFMTFGFSKYPFFALFQAILIFETKEVIILFHFETFIEICITYFDIFTRF